MLYYPFDYNLPQEEIATHLRDLGDLVLLDSCHPASQFGRYDLLSAAPDRVARIDAQGHLSWRDHRSDWQSSTQDVFSLLDSWLDELKPQASAERPPFSGGLIGHLSYDLGRTLEKLPQQAQADIDFPWLRIGRYLWALVTDHHAKQRWLVVHPHLSESFRDQLLQRLDAIPSLPLPETPEFYLTSAITRNMTEAEYQQALAQVHEYILAGDCYQINFAQRFQAECRGDPWHAWAPLKQAAPTPFAAYLESEDGTLLSLSPERFLACSATGTVETRPIKGTRPRAEDPEEDAALAAELLASEKERAENLMIVDLLRNDLSHSCQPGSVQVPELFKLESYPNVHHLVSVVRGQLQPSLSPLQLLKHCFPGGSITGAPKIRAMEIIDELEPHRRSGYCGSILLLSACGRMDSSITIRTLLCQNQKIYCWAGGGIVLDSLSEAEYQETLNKVGNLLRPLDQMRK
ncbi:aminodeoxychorismate synthase component I [Nitrincola tapanii]|uniref:aminodeoxychorismate synthase n=1 Tax=Nitrincola tapanii TaxID=1708751 RepID=A0A5A9W5Q3_9GAMM|nr:aminodeoxychorismate synthase component I [Nitrincola tapanii]KAA0875873.1 aminodeoxychorismate synthase component I [Nitrincola tapanii]